MAHSPGMSADGEVVEGFLCPICYRDLKSFNQLQEHFEQYHSAEEQDVLRTLKDLFGKAKKKILKQDNESEENKFFEESSALYRDSAPISDYLAYGQELGSTRSHKTYFKGIRDFRIDRYVIETNKLLIRLDKLITEAPDDPEKRKVHEQNIVPWIPDGDVRLCPGCAKSFGISRRRHHCRLCGGVMCKSCSNFIDFHFARKLIEPTGHENKLTVVIPSPFQRKGSNTSLLSMVSMSGEPHIRICRDCRALLIRRDQQIEDQNFRPSIISKYERMREYMEDVEKLSPLYIKMVNSLSAGETSYNLRDAQEVKVKLSKVAEGIDAISKSITRLPSNSEEEDSSTSSNSVQLHSSIRMAAVQFLRTYVLGLPQLPSEEEIARCRRFREEQIQRKIQLEKEAELLSARSITTSEKSPQNNTHIVASNKQEALSPVNVDSGWSASPGKITEEQDNPLLQQMAIIRRYIKQARTDLKFDEVHMLEANLNELQLAYLKEKDQKLPT